MLKTVMNLAALRASLDSALPPAALPAPLEALWWDAKGDWPHAHSLVDELDTPEGMAVHAYLHRKEGADWNANYWYTRAGRRFHRPTLHAEWEALALSLLRIKSEHRIRRADAKTNPSNVVHMSK